MDKILFLQAFPLKKEREKERERRERESDRETERTVAPCGRLSKRAKTFVYI